VRVAVSPIVIEVRPSWARSLRSAVYDALFTGYRGYWLVRLAFALLMGVTGQVGMGLVGRAACADVTALAMFLLLLPAAWFLYPLARLPARRPFTVTVLDEGLSVEAESSALSVTREAVRSVRRTPWDLVIVLDGSTISVPLRMLPAGTVDAVVARLHGPSREPAPRSDGSTARPHAPYRVPESRPLGPEDEEASPREWVAPAQYRESVLAFPTSGDHVRALHSLKRSAFFMPAVLFVLAGLLVLLGTSGGGDRPGELVRFTSVGAVVALIAVASVVLDVSPALFALRDRAVRERSAGVLYAIGASGLYLRTQSFERREPWDHVYVLRAGSRRVAIFTASLVHVIPVTAFQTDVARATFVSTIEREIAKRPRRVYT
jgi:hypothetical protein